MFMFIYYITKYIVAMKYRRNNYVFPYSMLENESRLGNHKEYFLINVIIMASLLNLKIIFEQKNTDVFCVYVNLLACSCCLSFCLSPTNETDLMIGYLY